MERRFSVIEGKFFLAASTFLDPKFKKAPLTNASNIKNMEDELIGLMRTEETPNARTSTKQPEPVRSMPQQRKKSLWSKFDTKIEKTLHASTQPSTGPYVEKPHTGGDDDPLAW